jgi:hypothetical protein
MNNTLQSVIRHLITLFIIVRFWHEVFATFATAKVHGTTGHFNRRLYEVENFEHESKDCVGSYGAEIILPPVSRLIMYMQVTLWDY